MVSMQYTGFGEREHVAVYIGYLYFLYSSQDYIPDVTHQWPAINIIRDISGHSHHLDSPFSIRDISGHNSSSPVPKDIQYWLASSTD